MISINKSSANNRTTAVLMKLLIPAVTKSHEIEEESFIKNSSAKFHKENIFFRLYFATEMLSAFFKCDFMQHKQHKCLK